jgi:hypothetical protein
MKKHIFNKHLAGLVFSLVLLVLFFLYVDPEGKPLVYIFVPVLLAWVFLFCLVQILSGFIFTDRSLLRSILSFVGVSISILLLLLSGVDQLTSIDIVLSVGLVAITTFYFYRMWS